MLTKYSPSVHIIRDKNREITYIPTHNATQVAQIIWDSLQQGGRSFNLIGSFGTGKSAFLWAFEQSVRGQKHYFQFPFEKDSKIDFISCVGEYKSLKSYLQQQLNLEENVTTQDILAEVYQRYHNLGKGDKVLFLLLDEFGKFLEYAAKNNPEEEIYFIQQLAEFCNNPNHNIVLLTTVHQNFEAYSSQLSAMQREEWRKVKGRFRDIAFNETVEQLLFLAAERMEQLDLGNPDKKAVQQMLQLHTGAKAFIFLSEIRAEQGLKLFPLDLFSANVITLALQRYGQNERSLFSFLENPDYTGLRGYRKRSNPFYNLSNVYDYLIFNFYSYLTSQANPDKAIWSSIKNALDKVENNWEKEVDNAKKIIKSIGLLQLFAQHGSTLDEIFWIKYAQISLGIDDAENIIEELEKNQTILYQRHNKRFILFEGTDVDIYSTLEAAGKQVEITDIATLVEKNYALEPIFAKSYYYKTGTPRLFEFKISNYPLEKLLPQGEIDGFINLVFNDKLSIKDVVKTSSAQQEAVLYGFYLNSKAIKELLFEIERTKKALRDVNQRDKVALKEFEGILAHQQSLLNHYILNNLYSNSANEICWVYEGQQIQINDKRTFNAELSKICESIYAKAPHYKNELVNRHKLPAPIYTAKRNFLKALTANWGLENMGFDKDKFPPEKTIFITLLRENGLWPDSKNPAHPIEITDNSTFTALWEESNTFLHSTRKNRRRVSELTEVISKRPFKIKQGLIEFWLPTFLYIKRYDFALFQKGVFIANINDEILELVNKYPQDYEIKAFDLDGIRLDIFNSYRLFLNQQETTQPTQQTFIETIKPFLIFFKSLPEYAKNTKRLSKEAFAVRGAIANSTDPEKTFFEDFPLALGYSSKHLQSKREHLEQYAAKLQDAIREIRTSFDELLNRYEAFIQAEVIYESMPFTEYQVLFRERYKDLKKHLLLPHQKTFVQRLYSELDDRKAWLASLAQSLIGKNIESLRDEEEVLLYDKFKTIISDLDSLTNISQTDINEETESVFQLEIASFDDIQKKIVRLPKKKQTEINTLQAHLKAQLSADKTINIAALIQTLQDLMKKQNT